jgi:hypothetical protein
MWSISSKQELQPRRWGQKKQGRKIIAKHPRAIETKKDYDYETRKLSTLKRKLCRELAANKFLQKAKELDREKTPVESQFPKLSTCLLPSGDQPSLNDQTTFKPRLPERSVSKS